MPKRNNSKAPGRRANTRRAQVNSNNVPKPNKNSTKQNQQMLQSKSIESQKNTQNTEVAFIEEPIKPFKGEKVQNKPDKTAVNPQPPKNVVNSNSGEVLAQQRKRDELGTNLLNTNIEILEVLNKMYGTIDQQVTEVGPNGTHETPKEEKPEDKKDKTPIIKQIKDSGSGFLSMLKGMLAGSLSGLLGSFFIKRMPMFLAKAFGKGVLKSLKLVVEWAPKIAKLVSNGSLKLIENAVKFIKDSKFGELLKAGSSKAKSILEATKKVGGKAFDSVKRGGKSLLDKASGVFTKSKMGTKMLKKEGIKLAEKGALKLGARGLYGVPFVGQVIAGAMTASDAVDGWKDASNALDIKKEETTTRNKTASALASVATLGFGNDKLAKGINKVIGGETSTIIKRYENLKVINHNYFGSTDVDMGAFRKLNSKQMKEIISINDFSPETLNEMTELIEARENIEDSKISKAVKPSKDYNEKSIIIKKSSTTNNTTNNLKPTSSIKNNQYNTTFNNQTMQNNTDGDLTYLYNQNTENSSSFNRYNSTNRTIVNTTKPEKTNVLLNKENRESLVDKSSNNLAQSESQILAIHANMPVVAPQIHTADNTVDGSDRLLNLFY